MEKRSRNTLITIIIKSSRSVLYRSKIPIFCFIWWASSCRLYVAFLVASNPSNMQNISLGWICTIYFATLGGCRSNLPSHPITVFSCQAKPTLTLWHLGSSSTIPRLTICMSLMWFSCGQQEATPISHILSLASRSLSQSSCWWLHQDIPHLPHIKQYKNKTIAGQSDGWADFITAIHISKEKT